MTGETFNPFKKIYDAPLLDTDVAQIAAALSKKDSGDLPNEAAMLLHRFSVLLEVNKTAAQSNSLDDLLPKLIEVIKNILHSDRATLFLYDEEANELFSRLAQGGSINEIRIPHGAGIAGTVFTTGETLIIPDAYEDPRFNREVDDHTSYRTHNILCVPLRNKDKNIIGVTQLLNKSSGDFSPDDAQLLEVMTSQVSAALEHAQMYEKLELAHSDEAALLEIASVISSNLDLDNLLVKIMVPTSKLFIR